MSVSKKLLFGAAIVGSLVLGNSPRAADLEKRAREVARELPWLGVEDALFDRDPRLGPRPQQVARGMQKLRELQWHGLPGEEPPLADVRALLKHADPKVRTLGIVLLFDLERVDVLPDIATLAGDAGETFPEPAPIAVTIASDPGDAWPLEKRTVGDWARAAIRPYVEASYELGQDKLLRDVRTADAAALRERITKFAASRDPASSTAGLVVAVERATGEIESLQPERAGRAAEVIRRVTELPMPRQFFVALRVDFERFKGEGYVPDYLLALARRVPREARLAPLRGERGIDDPDLPPGFGYSYFLDHPVDLFRESDARLLLDLEQKVPERPWYPGDENRLGNAAYAIAAARLRPEEAEGVLTAAVGRYGRRHQDEQRMALAAALAELGSDKGVGVAVDWFYREDPHAGSFGGGREEFLDRLHERSPMRYKAAVARIVKDERLNTLGPPTTRMLLTSVEGYLGRSLADEEDVRQSYGFDEAQQRGKFEPLGEWQKKLRDTAEEWDR